MSSPAPARARRGTWVVDLPDAVPAAFGAFSVVAMLLLVLGRYEPWLVLPLGTLAALAAVRAARLGGGDPRFPDRRPIVVLGLLILAAAIVNVVFASEYLYAFRDPATYGILGRWLVDHSAALFPYDNSIFGHVPGNDPGSLGFGVLPDRSAVYAQGNHLVPALLAVPGWIAGGDAVLWANPVLGALSLASVYALARRLVGAWWGLLPPFALAASMPYLAFVRATYSEPVTMLLLLGGMALVCRALERQRSMAMFVAGLTLGAAALARVDSYAALLAVPVAITVWCATAAPAERRRRLRQAVAIAAGVAVPLPIAIYDLAVLSPAYWDQRISETSLLGIAAIGLAIGGYVVVALAWRTRLPDLLGARWRGIALIVSGGVVVAFAFLASRPLWYVARDATPEMVPNIAALQEGLDLPIDPLRTYDELSVSWIAWYFGWPTVVLGVAGLALLVHRAVRHRDPVLALPLTAVMMLSALYLTRVLIYPDQIWAMRRLLPVVLPGVLIGAAWALARLWGSDPNRGRRGRRASAGGLAAVALAVPALVSLPLSPVVEYGGQRAEVAAVCDALPPDAAVLTVDAVADAGYLQTIRVFCDVPVSSLADPSPEQLAAMTTAAGAGGRALHVVTAEVGHVAWRTPPNPVSTQEITKWNESLESAPQVGIRFGRVLYVGSVAPDGLVDPAAVS